MLDVLRGTAEAGALRRGHPLRAAPPSGYVGVLEDCLQPGPVHSLWRGRRSHRLVVSDEVRTALRKARLVGLELEEVDGPFPADDRTSSTTDRPGTARSAPLEGLLVLLR